jgi:hypothetical protein
MEAWWSVPDLITESQVTATNPKCDKGSSTCAFTIPPLTGPNICITFNKWSFIAQQVGMGSRPTRSHTLLSTHSWSWIWTPMQTRPKCW